MDKKQTPLISVVLIAYNGEAYLHKMLDSILKQSFEQFELVCVDDGSSDQTASIFAQYNRLLPQKIQTFTIPNAGAAQARLFGLRQCCGEYVCILDCDDFLFPDMLERLYQSITENNADMAVCGFHRVDENLQLLSTEMVRPRPLIDQNNRGAMATINTALWNKLFRRSCIPTDLSLGRIKQGDDLAFLLCVYPQIKRVSFVERPLYNYIIHPQSLMSTLQKESFSLFCAHSARAVSLCQDQTDYGNLVTMVFISLCCSQLYKFYCQEGRNPALLRQTRAFFNKSFPAWWKHGCFTLKNALHERGNCLAIYAAGKLFRFGCFSIYLGMLHFMKEKVKFKIKW